MAYLIDQDVLDIREQCRGLPRPGLRWRVMGPALLCELGAPPGRVHHLLEHLADPMTALWADLGAPALTSPLRQQIVAGVRSEVGDRSRELLTDERDELLIGLLKLRAHLSRKSGRAPRAHGRRGMRQR